MVKEKPEIKISDLAKLKTIVYFSVSKDRAQILQPQPPRRWYHRHMQSLSAPKPFLIEIHPPATQNKLEAMAEPGVLW